MSANSLPILQKHQDDVHLNSKQINLKSRQEKIYKLLGEIASQCPPEDALQEFKRLFIDYFDSVNLNIRPVFSEIYFINNEQEFRDTLKRCCYILINYWISQRKIRYIQEIINIFENYHSHQNLTQSTPLNIYKKWLENFINSKDYEELKLFAYRHNKKEKTNWANRYIAYLLVPQYCDKNNPKEQQEAAAKLSKQIKNRFKFELAMYIARSQSAASSETRYKNPSALGDNVLRIIKLIVIKRGVFNYENLANIFIKQTKNELLKDFKKSLHKYLFVSVKNSELIKILKQHLEGFFACWEIEENEEIINDFLLLKICNRVIDCLTIENGQEPSQLFLLLLSQGHPLTLVVILLKIILICPDARSHLEIRIANLISYYQNDSEDDCKWLINFIEIFNITFAIYVENVEYNLIKMEEDTFNCNSQSNLEAYRVFSQLK
ncbi:hypothetical protein NIES4103_66800 [Nostoc sp. NIES-4103]|nr:hypothetical protein NIES4103_66800 [Nostoc sp. NIES-4103]